MIVKDIIDDAGDILAYCDRPRLYNRLNHAIEVLANKGNWSPMMAYMDIATVNGNEVVLPSDVEIPIRINLNNNPSFQRDRLYEFTMNGPGTDMADAGGFSWMDKGPTPVFLQPPVTTPAMNLIMFSGSVLDNLTGRMWTVEGIDEFGNRQQETWELTNSEGTAFATSNHFVRIDNIHIDDHDGFLTLKTAGVLPTVLANYDPRTNDPEFRRIRLTQSGAAVKILFRRKVFKITSDLDFIPLNSQMAILLALKSLEKMRNEDFDNAKKLMDQALEFIKDEQSSLMGFDLNQATQAPTALDLGYNNNDSVIVADVYDEISGLLGPIGQGAVFDYITETVQALANKGIWDNIDDGYVDIATHGSQYITLPRYVDSILAINLGGRPTFPRNKWFEFHLNGPGTECNGTCRAWDDRGTSVTLQELNYTQQLVALPQLAADNDVPVRVYGTYQGKEVYFADGPNGSMKLGIPVTCNVADVLPAVDAPKIDIITRVTKGESRGFITLMGYSLNRDSSTMLGYYYPDETEPNYRRIKISANAEWVRLRYRKRSRKVTSLTDPLHLRSKLAITTMCQSLVALKKGDTQAAAALDAMAVQYLSEEQAASNPTETFSFSFDNRVHMADPCQGII